MKYYQLVKDLPTFKKGELFYINDYGQLMSYKHRNVVAYSALTIKEFPNILKDWFEEVPEPERDEVTKQAFMEYLSENKQERFFQAVRNFAIEYLGDDFCFIFYTKYADIDNDKIYDTFYLECDRLHEMRRNNDNSPES